MSQLSLQQAIELAQRHQLEGQFAQAEAVYRQILSQRLTPDSAALAHNNLGNLLLERNRLEEAISSYQAATRARPDLAQPWLNLADALQTAGRFEDAIEAYRKSIQLNPKSADAHNNLGGALNHLGRAEEAIASYQTALRFNPRLAECHNNLGKALRDLGKTEQAIASFGRAIEIDPNLAAAHANLGAALSIAGRVDEAMAACGRAIQLKPDLAPPHHELGNALKAAGRLDEAIDAYREAISLNPTDPLAHSTLIYSLYFHPNYDARAIAEEERQWNQRHAKSLARLDGSRQIDRDPDRRPLRVGYISSDFRDHCQSFFTIPLLAHHDRSQFRIFCYSGVRHLDAISGRIQGHADEWRNIAGLSGDRVARMIQDDRIDILVELNLHMAGNYLLLLARKPAPVQVTWLGYPGSTGVEAIDYRITDPHLDPPGTGESFYSEQSIHLPESFWCYDPLTSEPAVIPLPALTGGCFTFGSLNSFAKVNDRVISLWARAMNVVPGSRLLIICEAPSARQRTSEKFVDRGIDSTRIEFSDRLSRQDYLKLYNRIDVALDTFPANGHTTSLDGLWMGVPVITLPGATAISRGGLSILSNLGLREFVADSEESFVEIARTTSADLPRLSELRLNLRIRMQRSPLMDGTRFAFHMEQAYRQMWRRFCVADKLASA